MKFVTGCIVFGLIFSAGLRAVDSTSERSAPSLDSAFLQRIAERAAPGVFAAAFVDLQTHRTVEWAGDRPMPMQSVFKAVLAAAVLSQVDAGTLALSDTITLKQSDLSPPYSPIADAWPKPDRYTIAELLKAAAGGSDNTAADVLMKRIGGPDAVTRFLRAKGIEGIRVDRYEREFQVEAIGLGPFRVEWLGDAAFAQAMQTIRPEERLRAVRRYLGDVRDTATPRAAVDFMKKLVDGELISASSTALLIEIMTTTRSGPHRLKAGLPAGARITHKTGTGRTDLGINQATNDIAVVTLADGRRYAIASFLAGSTLSAEENERVHAEAATKFFEQNAIVP